MPVFLVWSALCCLPAISGVYAFFAKKPVRFLDVKTVPITDIKGYNRAMGFLWLGYAAAMEALGLPLLAGMDSPLCFITLIGTVLCSVLLMVVYDRLKKVCTDKK
ncbi:MAG: hypothetical protein Q4G07_00130 [Oscillospiraceae bacterium]|nr:hypothetical protein [Oscillospiraceae bacterium]